MKKKAKLKPKKKLLTYKQRSEAMKLGWVTRRKNARKKLKVKK